MIKYDPADWEKLESIEELSLGEMYFVSHMGDVSLMEFDGQMLSNDTEAFDLSEGIPDELYLMGFNWPDAPRQEKEIVPDG